MFPSVIFPLPVILSACAYAGGVIDVLASIDVINTVVVKATIAPLQNGSQDKSLPYRQVHYYQILQ